MRYRLRTLLMLMAIGPPMLATAWFVGTDHGAVVVLTGLALALLPIAVSLGVVAVATALAVRRHNRLGRQEPPINKSTVP